MNALWSRQSSYIDVIYAYNKQNNYSCAFGGVGVVCSGDFLQLPPVEKHSLADPLESRTEVDADAPPKGHVYQST
eukprot:7482296-Alexandrium_andersonii.AAC.1